MARETWVVANRRVLGLALLAPGALLTTGVAMCLTVGNDWRLVAGILIMSVSAATIGLLVRESIRPRVAYRDGRVEFYLRAGSPLAVPLEHVEAFFLGQGSVPLPARIKIPMETVTLVARLSRRADEWSHRDVNPALGRWCDGYVTIRGLWCEPLTIELVAQLNRRLHEVAREVFE